MPNQQTFEVAGVDGCKGGWFVIIASVTKENNQASVQRVLKLKNSFVANTFAEVFSRTSDCKLVCIDIPIGLSDGRKQRECDIEARKVLRRPRASSVFPAPIRPSLSADDYKTASKISFEHSGKKLNRQSFFLHHKICQVDDLMTPTLQRRIREIHPEVSFWALNSKKTMEHNKKSLAGHRERIKVLCPFFPDIEEIIAKARKSGKVATDDVLDALVAVWTASQTVMGKAMTLPRNPNLDSKGLRMEILCPVG